jgi:hypothetical protein
MATTYDIWVLRDEAGKVSGVSYAPITGVPLEQITTATYAEYQAFLNPPEPLPDLYKWQLWLAALELEPPIYKAGVLASVEGMADLSDKEKETIRIMIEDTQGYKREDPRIDLLAQVMGISPAQMDSLWRWAASFSPM